MHPYHMQGYEKIILKEILKECVQFGDFTLSSGKKSDFYIDCRKVTLTSKFMYFLGMYQCWSNKPAFHYDTVIGMISGACPIVSALVAHNNYNGLFVRKQQKEHGMKKRIEGKFEIGEKCLIVDDVLTTGTSIIEVNKVAVEAGLVPKHVLVLVDRQENNTVKRIIEETGLNVTSIFTKGDFINE